jgi:ribonuclease HI
MSKIIIYTDGAATGNPGPGGYGSVLIWGNYRKELSGGFRLTTNNRMELLAVIEALDSLKRADIPIEIYTDSQYVVNAINKKWLYGWIQKKFAKTKNPDLWERFVPLWKKFNPTFIWVKGHAGIPENERCDVLATTAAKANNLPIDIGYENSLNEGEDSNNSTFFA